MKKITDTLKGVNATKKLADLQSWYERGYFAEKAHDEIADAVKQGRATSDQQLAYQAGRTDAAKGRLLKEMLD